MTMMEGLDSMDSDNYPIIEAMYRNTPPYTLTNKFYELRSNTSMSRAFEVIKTR